MLTPSPTCAAAPSLGDIPPGEDPYFSTPAALLFAAQLVELIADVLDQPLPYPIARRDAVRYWWITNSKMIRTLYHDVYHSPIMYLISGKFLRGAKVCVFFVRLTTNSVKFSTNS